MFVFSGAALTLIGPTLTELRERTGTGIGDIGVLFVALSLGGVVGSLAAGHLLDRFDGHRIYAPRPPCRWPWDRRQCRSSIRSGLSRYASR